MQVTPETLDTVIQGGTVITPTGAIEADIGIEGDKIAAIGEELDTAGATVIDAAGHHVLPGVLDVHVHLDILGHSDYQHWHGRYRDRYADVMEISARQLRVDRRQQRRSELRHSPAPAPASSCSIQP